MTLNLDLSDVQENNGGLEPGEYNVSVEEAEVRTTKAGNGEYIRVKFTTETGFPIYHMFNIKNPSPDAVKIGLGQLKAFMAKAGLDASKLTDVAALEGAMVRVRTKHDDRGYTKITSFKPVGTETKEETKGSAVF